MPKSKQHPKRKRKLKQKRQDTNKWVKRKVAAFNAMPEDAREGILKSWRLGKQKEEDDAISG